MALGMLGRLRPWRLSKRAAYFTTHGSNQVKAVCVHDLGPSGTEVFHKLLLVVVLRVDLSIRSQD